MGFFHGLILYLYRPFERLFAATQPRTVVRTGPFIPSRLLSILIMFHLTCVGWLFFRAESVAQVWGMT